MNKATSKEENPFEDPIVAAQWIQSRESEEDRIYTDELVPLLQSWMNDVSPKTLVDIGSGQGITSELFPKETNYIGVEPSSVLVERAKEKYPHRDWKIGSAYQLPVDDSQADTALSINVWFHLENIYTATRELARVLNNVGSL
jgi:ubiquinone/menaquinone biosynthesis C-methylase UbiE